jgi:uncharacterized membrane protein YraQ (UPF0718 family)
VENGRNSVFPKNRVSERDSSYFFQFNHRKNTIKETNPMLNDLLSIANFILAAFLHIWPYLLVTIPLAVAIRLSGASRYISWAFDAQPMLAIVLATAVGAFSPFCSCGVIPVIAALLIGGVPLAPVMSFWIASPSMDPEVFFLSVATIGWQLAVWRLAGTLALSLSAGFITHFMMRRGWLGSNYLRQQPSTPIQSAWALIKDGWQSVKRRWITPIGSSLVHRAGPIALAETACCATITPAEVVLTDDRPPAPPAPLSGCGCGSAQKPAPRTESPCASSCGTIDGGTGSTCGGTASFWQRLLKETWAATTMVAKFMLLTFFLEALITLYLPAEWTANLLGTQNRWAILFAALLGVPVYTSNMAALPLVSGLLGQGMHPAAALAFLIAGPTTTLPAMAAVWGLASRRVFALYVSFSLVGAIVLGYIFAFVSGL